jgi:hypothetical protein
MLSPRGQQVTARKARRLVFVVRHRQLEVIAIVSVPSLVNASRKARVSRTQTANILVDASV